MNIEFRSAPWFYRMDHQGETPMSRAHKSGYPYLIELLKAQEERYKHLSSEALSTNDLVFCWFFQGKSENASLEIPSPSFRDTEGNTPLMAAICCDLFELAEQLILDGADVNAANHYGITCLHLAVMNGSHAMVELLLAHHVEVNPPLAKGCWLTPSSLALVMGYDDLFARISQCGGKVRFIP